MHTFLPPIELIIDNLTTLARTSQNAGDTTAANAFNRAVDQLERQGVRPYLSSGDLLLPSRTTDGTVHRVTALGCSCKAGINGRQCWHMAVWEGIARAWDELDQIDAHRPDAGDFEPEPSPAAPALRLVPRPDDDDDAAYAAMLAAA
jgi:flavin-binding protein dodecin